MPAAVETQVPGTLVVWHKDYFAEGRGEYGFGVYTDAAQMTPLNLAAASPGVLRPGMTVKRFRDDSRRRGNAEYKPDHHPGDAIGNSRPGRRRDDHQQCVGAADQVLRLPGN